MKQVVIVLSILSGFSCLGQDLTIQLELDDCINTNNRNTVVFKLENTSDKDIWIKTEFLNFYFSIYSTQGDTLRRKTTRHLNPIDKEEYTLIPANSATEVNWQADFFDNFDFAFDKKYFISTSYEYSYLNRSERKKSKRTDFNLIQQKIDARSNDFERCK